MLLIIFTAINRVELWFTCTARNETHEDKWGGWAHYFADCFLFLKCIYCIYEANFWGDGFYKIELFLDYFDT